MLVTPGGLEPPTNSLEGCCSIQLSYGAAPRGLCSGFPRRIEAVIDLGGAIGEGPIAQRLRTSSARRPRAKDDAEDFTTRTAHRAVQGQGDCRNSRLRADVRFAQPGLLAARSVA